MIAVATIIVLTAFASGLSPAQDDDGLPPSEAGFPDTSESVDPSGSPDSPESMKVSTLDEQLPLTDDGAELEQEVERVAVRSRSARWSAGWRVRGSGVLQEGAGYPAGQYAGDRFRIYQRLVVARGNAFGLGFLTEKDPGEAALTDFVSGVLSLGDLPGGSRIVAGDFRIRAGQGLLFGSPRSFGKGAAAIDPVVRSGAGIPAGISSDEVSHFRGFAASVGEELVTLTVFSSWNKRSPRVSPTGELTGIDQSGYHRTAAELGRKGLVSERACGGTIGVRVAGWLTVGVNALRTIHSPGTAADGVPAFRGVSSGRMSGDFRIVFRALTCFGEVLSTRSGVPWIGGLLFAPSGGSRIVVVTRHYPAASELDRTYGFADGSTGRNEDGTYLGVELTLFPVVRLSGFVDLVSAPASERGGPFPPARFDRLISLRLDPSRRFRFEAIFRSRSDDAAAEEGVAGAPNPGPRDGAKGVERVRCEIGWSPAERLSCRVRTELSVATPGRNRATEKGSMISADFTFDPARWVSVHARLLLFDTDSFASGIYSAEADLPGTITGTLLNGEGTRWYVVCVTKLSKNFRIAVKYSRYRRDDLRNLGSGAEKLPSNIAEKAGFQVDLTL